MSDSKSTAEPSRPQTVLLTKLRDENNSPDDDTSVGDAFFSKNYDDGAEVIDQTPKVRKLKFNEAS